MTLSLPEETTAPSLGYSYWIINIPFYGTFVFYGSDKDAENLLDKKSEWEQTRGSIRLADPDKAKDRELVSQEIKAVREDRAAGIKGLPYLPSKGWV